MTPGGYGLATYPWDLSNIANATPADQKTSLLEVSRDHEIIGLTARGMHMSACGMRDCVFRCT